MTEEPRAKSFKSGNSVALRLPVAFGIEPGKAFRIIQHADGSMTVIPEHRAKDAFMALAGSMSKGWMADGRMDQEQESRDWSRGTGQAVP